MMNRHVRIGVILLFISFAITALTLQLSEITRYICRFSGADFSMRCFANLNPISIVCLVALFGISIGLIFYGIKKNDK